MKSTRPRPVMPVISFFDTDDQREGESVMADSSGAVSGASRAPDHRRWNHFPPARRCAAHGNTSPLGQPDSRGPWECARCQAMDAPRPGTPARVTPEWRAMLVSAVRRRPRSLGQPYSLWTLQRLADYLAEETGVRVSYETVRRYLAQEEIALRRPQHKISSPDPEYEVKTRRSKQRGTA